MSLFRRNPQRPYSAIEATEQMRNLLAFILVGAFISVLPVLTLKAIPTENKDIITYMVGQLSGMATMALGFYFVNKVGQDAADAKRADNTGKMAEAVIAAATGKPAASDKAIEDMSVDELIAAALKMSVPAPDPMDEAVLRAALIAKRDGGVS